MKLLWRHDAEHDEGVAAGRGFLLQQPRAPQQGGLARGGRSLAPPRLAGAVGGPAPAKV